ncbi:hypothetical protein C8R45DRAFT_937279 [Mycena sanguinolenta]|nr:hypothetical protein C8R45DRAFT_937279 [Mycena sanguinolenta]
MPHHQKRCTSRNYSGGAHRKRHRYFRSRSHLVPDSNAATGIRARRIPEQFLQSSGQAIAQKLVPRKGPAPAGIQVQDSNLEEVTESDAGHGSQVRNLRSPRRSEVAAESIHALHDAQQGAQNGQTVTARLRRVEGQLDALLPVALPESSPPS